MLRKTSIYGNYFSAVPQREHGRLWRTNMDFEIWFENQWNLFTMIKGEKFVRTYQSHMKNMGYKFACMIVNFTDGEKFFTNEKLS